RRRAEATKEHEPASPLKSTAEIMASWGIIGTWAANCRLPSGNQNPYLRFVVTNNGRVSYERDTKIKYASAVLRATITTSGSLEFTIPDSAGSSIIWRYTLQKGANGGRRIVDVRRADGGGQTISNGIITSIGRPTLWIHRCQ